MTTSLPTGDGGWMIQSVSGKEADNGVYVAWSRTSGHRDRGGARVALRMNSTWTLTGAYHLD
jgi:hypothetical protein